MKTVSKLWALELKGKPNVITADRDGQVRIYQSRREARENKRPFEKIVPVEVFDAE